MEDKKLPIPSTDYVYRQIPESFIKFDNGKYIPKSSNFKPDPDGLSVNWSRMISLEDTYILIGLSYRHKKEEYKDHRQFKVFKFNVGFLRSISGIESVEHNPVINGNPAPVGKPNNYSHSLVMYQDDELIRKTLSTHIRDNQEDTYCLFEANSLNERLEELRQRLNDTPYHRA